MMHIALIAKPWRGGLADYVHAALRDIAGPEQVTYLPVRPVQLRDSWGRVAKRHWYDRLYRHLETTPYDMVLFLQPTGLMQAIADSHKKVCWLVDGARIDPQLAAGVGHLFLSDPGNMDVLKTRAPAHHIAGILPFAMAPHIHCPGPASCTADRAMGFIANHDPKRDAWLESMFAAGLDCHVHGNYFLSHPLFRRHPLRIHPAVPVAAMQALYARYRLSLNIHAAIVQGGTNMRTFEAAGYGVPQLVEHLPGIDQLFDPDTEIATFRTIEELTAQQQRLLANPAAATRMAANARVRVLAEHTYHHRMQTILARFR